MKCATSTVPGTGPRTPGIPAGTVVGRDWLARQRQADASPRWLWLNQVRHTMPPPNARAQPAKP